MKTIFKDQHIEDEVGYQLLGIDKQLFLVTTTYIEYETKLLKRIKRDVETRKVLKLTNNLEDLIVEFVNNNKPIEVSSWRLNRVKAFIDFATEKMNITNERIKEKHQDKEDFEEKFETIKKLNYDNTTAICSNYSKQNDVDDVLELVEQFTDNGWQVLERHSTSMSTNVTMVRFVEDGSLIVGVVTFANLKKGKLIKSLTNYVYPKDFLDKTFKLEEEK